MVFLVKSLLKAGLTLGAIAAVLKSNPDDIAKVAYSVTKNFKNLECTSCAAALRDVFKAKGVSGEVIQLTPKGGGYWNIWSDLAADNIGRTGFHQAVKVGDTVFDNIHKKGVPYAEWIKDFSTSGPNGLVVTTIETF